MNFNNLTVADELYVRTVVINRPEKLNALNKETLSELHAAFDQAKTEANVRAVLLTGSGAKAFVAGADIGELNTLSATDALAFSRYGQELMWKIEHLGKPVVALINGFALGGGMELALACTLRIASDTAKLGLPEINLGILPGFGGTQRLVRQVGKGAALELCLFGQPIAAQRAYELGLVNQVVPAGELAEHGKKLAAKLAQAAPHAVNAILNAISIGGEASLQIGLDYEAQAFAVCMATEDMREGTSAFLQKRPPTFKGA